MGQKYVIRDFHPLVFFYMAGLVTWLIGFALAVYSVGPVHAVRHVVRHGKQQGASLSRAALTKASGFEEVDDHGRR